MAELKIRLPDALHARFAMRAQRGDVARGLAILDELDERFAKVA